MEETKAQALFWFSMGGAPIVLGLLVIGLRFRRERISTILGVALVFAVAQFLWYFETLGIGLADKTGGIKYPEWSSYMSTALGVAILVLAASFAFIFLRRRVVTHSRLTGTTVSEQGADGQLPARRESKAE